MILLHSYTEKSKIESTFRAGLHLENRHFKSCFACGLVDRSDKDFTNPHCDVVISALF